MADELARIGERIRQNRHARAAEQDTRAADARGDLLRGDASIRAGARVFDPVTGLEGEIVNGPAPSGARGDTIAVRLVNGAVVARRPAELLERPKPPTVTR